MEKTNITHDRHIARAIVVDEEVFSTLSEFVETISLATEPLSKRLVVVSKLARHPKRRFIGS